MILVTGATGQTGSHVVRSLLARGAAVRVFVRDADRARSLFGDAVDVAPGDFAYPPSLRAALAGADALFLSGADDPRRVEWETDAIDAASRRRHPAHVLACPRSRPRPARPWRSGTGTAGRSSTCAAGGVPATCRSWARASTRPTCSPRPSGVALRRAACTRRPVTVRIAMIDPRDVGDVAAAVLTAPGHDGADVRATGPEAISYAEVAVAPVGRGRPTWSTTPTSRTRRVQQAMVDAGLPSEPVAGQVVAIFAQTRRGVSPHVPPRRRATIPGRPPRGVAAFSA